MVGATSGVKRCSYYFDKPFRHLCRRKTSSAFSPLPSTLMKNPSDPVLNWLSELADVAERLPRVERPRAYFSQRDSSVRATLETSLPAIARRVRSLVTELEREHYFSEVIGFDCVDGNGDSDSSPEAELDQRIGKPHLWASEPELWTEADLCDFVEVFHDVAARPTRGWFHSFGGCGWHPTQYARKSGQSLYRWRVNQLLDTTGLDLRLADTGEDVGRMVRLGPAAIRQLVKEVLEAPSSSADDIAHAVALFRARGSSRQEQRSAIVALAAILEQRRDLLKTELLGKDEGSLFRIANEYDLRHRRADQYADYGTEFLEWIFYWYLATVRLTEQLLARPVPS